MTPVVAPSPVVSGGPSSSGSLTRHLVTILYIIIGLEIGLVLLLLPWTPFWSRNFFAERYAWMAAIAGNDFVRGAVSGLGLADVWLAFYEISRYRRARKAARDRTSLPQ